MQIKNVSGNDLEIVGVGTVAAGDEFEATGEHAKALLAQKGNFERTDAPDDDKPSKKGHRA